MFTNFPLHVNEGKLVDKLNYHVGNLEGNKYEVYIPWEKKRIRGDHGITYNNIWHLYSLLTCR